MDISEKQQASRIPVVDFVPAELKKGNKGVWRIEFYVNDPTTKSNRLKRIQKRVKPMPNCRERERFAKRIVFEINRKLDRGWNPILEQEAPRSLVTIVDAGDKFIRNAQKQLKDKILREDTLRTYKSFLNNFKQYLEEHGELDRYCLNFDRMLISDFLDHIYYDRNNSPRTYNNYLGFLVTFSNYLLKKGHIKANPAESFDRKKNAEKKRTAIEEQDLINIFKFLKAEDHPFYVVCQTMYQALTRRTEMSKLKVKDIHIRDRFIYIEKDTAKTNKKAETITIPKSLLFLLSDHINGAENSDYLFSADNFKPGPKRAAPKYFSDRWTKYKERNDWKEEYQFYSLKDTGITNLLLAGVPAKQVCDHARHHDISMTEKYIQKNSGISPEFLDGKLKM